MLELYQNIKARRIELGLSQDDILNEKIFDAVNLHT